MAGLFCCFMLLLTLDEGLAEVIKLLLADFPAVLFLFAFLIFGFANTNSKFQKYVDISWQGQSTDVPWHLALKYGFLFVWMLYCIKWYLAENSLKEFCKIPHFFHFLNYWFVFVFGPYLLVYFVFSSRKRRAAFSCFDPGELSVLGPVCPGGCCWHWLLKINGQIWPPKPPRHKCDLQISTLLKSSSSSINNLLSCCFRAVV